MAISNSCSHLCISVEPIVLISNYTLQQEFECEICKVKYKTKRGLNRHQSIVQKYNIRHEGLYVLPLEAVNQFKNDLIYIISSKLKGHFTQSGKQTLSFSCLESLFFEVFKGYIHYFNQKNGSYKCLFHGPDAYMQLASIFDNQNWGRKFFDNGQQTFILLFDAQAEKRSASNSKKRSEFPKLTVKWKTKHKKDAKNNQTSARYMYLNFYTLQI